MLMYKLKVAAIYVSICLQDLGLNAGDLNLIYILLYAKAIANPCKDRKKD